MIIKTDYCIRLNTPENIDGFMCNMCLETKGRAYDWLFSITASRFFGVRSGKVYGRAE